jgi:hypothetical protein
MSLAVVMTGHNNPPDCIESGAETSVALSAWLAENPLIYSEDQARDAKLLLDRAKSSAGEIEDNRKRETKPLNDRLDEINGRYKAMHNTDKDKPGILDKTAAELKKRLAVFLEAEEARREIIAREAARERDEKERLAREAEAREKDAIANAAAGELGVDVTQVVVAASKAFDEFKKADRGAARADRNTNVKVAGGWNRAASLRTKETLVLVSYGKAITAIGPHDGIRDAILSAAREYRKEKGNLPEGVSSEITRAI